ncbi:MAG: acyl-CoA synthetase, partial [Mycobacterium sp.]
RMGPDDFSSFLAAQPDLSPKAWPRYVRINADLPTTATNKILKRALMAAGVSAEGGVLWTRPARSTAYSSAVENITGRAASTAATP